MESQTHEPAAPGNDDVNDDVLAWDGEPDGASRPSADSAQPPRLRVRLLGLRARPQVGWFSDDGRDIGLLNPVYEEPFMISAGSPPASRIHVFAIGLGDDGGQEGELTVDLRDGAPHEVVLSVDHNVSPYFEHAFALLDSAGRPLHLMGAQLVLDGTHSSARDALLSYQQLYTDEEGRLELRLRRRRTVELALELPLAEKALHVRVEPDAKAVVLRGVVSVRCSFRCANGKRPGYAGYTAVAKMKDGTTRRFERPYGDVLRGEDVVLAWPVGAHELQLHSEGYVQAVLRSAKQRCQLAPIVQERCQEDPR